MTKTVGINFGDSKKIYYFVANKDINKNDFVVVVTERGEQLGKVVTDVFDVDEEKLQFELKDISRLATEEDKKNYDKNTEDAKQAVEDSIKIVEELGLDMRIIDASFTLDRSQLLIQFLADDRIDFRQMAKKLASIYKTRIELRQIGVRDKAKSIGGYGQCGRQLCCSSFLNELNSVSINMAKNQNLALNPQKINGVCGRLMCCLSYENDLYAQYKKGLPKVGEFVDTKYGKGKVIDVDLFSRKYKIETSDAKVIEIDK